jgi:hypothetical protein
MVSENRVLRRVFDPRRKEETQEWRKLFNEFHYKYTSPNIIIEVESKRMRWTIMYANAKGDDK